MKAVIGVIVVVLLAMSAIELANESTRALVFRPNGVEERGSAFGVQVNDTRGDAADALARRHFTRVQTKAGGRCLLRNFSSDYVLDLFDDNTWRKGTICIATREGRVEAILWMFNPFMP